MLTKINATLSTPFASLDDLLAFYQKELPKRVGNFRLDEVGPVMSTGSAEEVAGYMQNKFYYDGIGMDMPDKIDWFGTPTGDLEWNAGLVRHGHLTYLADAYEKTKDEKYASTIIAHMTDYIDSVPPYNPDGKPYLEYKKSTWRPLEASCRAAENWPVALAKIINSESMTAEAFAKIFYSTYEHMKFLAKYHWRTGNHACLESAGVAVIAMFFKEFAEGEELIKYVIDFLMTMFDEQFHRDGYTKEMSGAYHYVAMRNFFALYKVGFENGFADLFPAEYVEEIKSAAKAEFYAQKPDFSLPVTNDSNVLTVHRDKLEAFKILLDPEIIDYRLSGGKKGTKPPHNSYYFDSSRVAIMRSGWLEDDVYASFDMGLWGDNHMNEDQLNLEISAYGRNFLHNCGRWRYTTSPGIEWLSKAQYFKTTAAYNSILVNDCCQKPGDAFGNMTITDAYDYSKGTFTGEYGTIIKDAPPVVTADRGTCVAMTSIGEASHTREVFFEKTSNFFIVRDTVKSDVLEKATQIWHFGGGEAIVNGNTVCTNFDDVNLVMVQLNDAKIDVFCGSEEPFKGWVCPKYDNLLATPEVDCTLIGKNEVVFETLFFPIKGKSQNLPTFTKDGDTYVVTYNGTTTKISNDFKLI